MTCASAAARKMEKKEQGQWTERVSRENLTEWFSGKPTWVLDLDRALVGHG